MLKHVIAFSISGLFLWLAARQVEVDSFVAAMKAADPTLVAIAFGLTIAVCLLRGIRWRLLFSFAQRVPYISLLSVLMIGFLANNLLPARLGEVTMAFLIHHKERVGKSRAVGVILLDRLFDVFALVTLLSPVLLDPSFPPWVQGIGVVGGIGCVVGVCVIWLSVRHQTVSRRIATRIAGVLPDRIADRAMQFFNMFLEGLGVIVDPVRVVLIFLVSLSIWASLAVGVYLLGIAFGFDLSYGAAVTVMAIVNLGLIIPSSPGFIGTFQLFCVAALGLYGIDKSSALSFSVIYHLSQWLPTTLLGYYFLNRENLQLFRLSRLQSAPDEKAT